MSTFLNLPWGNTHDEWTDFVFSVKSFIKLKAEYCVLLWCVSIVSWGLKFEHFFLLSFFVIFTNPPAANSQLVAEELRHEHMLWKSLSRLDFRELCRSSSPITSQINSFCLQWHLLARAELINCRASFINGTAHSCFKMQQMFLLSSHHLISKKVETFLEDWYKPCSWR